MKNPVILTISEEYGYRNWYAILTAAAYAQLLENWKGMRGLNCLVPVQFLIPQARPLWDVQTNPATQPYLTRAGLRNAGAVIKFAHIHQSDDSSIGDLVHEIPEAELFTWCGQEYTEDDLTALMHVFRDREHREFDAAVKERPEILEDRPHVPEAWQLYQPDLPKFEVTEILYCAEDVPLPEGFERREDGKIVKTGAPDDDRV